MDLTPAHDWLRSARASTDSTASLTLRNIAADIAYSTGQRWVDRGRSRDVCYEKLVAANVPWPFDRVSYAPRWTARATEHAPRRVGPRQPAQSSISRQSAGAVVLERQCDCAACRGRRGSQRPEEAKSRPPPRLSLRARPESRTAWTIWSFRAGLAGPRRRHTVAEHGRSSGRRAGRCCIPRATALTPCGWSSVAAGPDAWRRPSSLPERAHLGVGLPPFRAVGRGAARCRQPAQAPAAAPCSSTRSRPRPHRPTA